MATSTTIRDSVVQIAVEDLPSHLASLETELSECHSIELVRGETVIAEVRAPKRLAEPERPADRPIPDFMARLRELYPDGPLDVDTTAMIREDRDARG
jgi:hypothetical protein